MHSPAAMRPIVFTRRLHPGEHRLLERHLLRLDTLSRRLRFGNVVNDTFVSRYAETSLDVGGLVLGLFVDGEVRGVAELRFTTCDGDQAEIAFSIEPDFQGFGHGTRLFGRIVDAARNRGVRRLWLTCLAENRRILAIARRFGATVKLFGNEATAELLDQHPGQGSLTREWAEESTGQLIALIDQRRRRFAELLSPSTGASTQALS